MAIGETETGAERGRFKTELLRSVMKDRIRLCAGEDLKRAKSAGVKILRIGGLKVIKERGGGGGHVNSGGLGGAFGGLLREVGILDSEWMISGRMRSV